MDRECVISYELANDPLNKDDKKLLNKEDETNIREMVKKINNNYIKELNNIKLEISENKKKQLAILIKLMNEVAHEWFGKLTIRYDEERLLYCIILNGSLIRFEKDKSKLIDIINNADDIEFYTTPENDSNVEILVTKGIYDTEKTNN
jgi:hypothetical protein